MVGLVHPGRLLIKICGITRAVDALDALRLGADAVGLNFVSGPRRIELFDAERLVASGVDPDRVVALVAGGGLGSADSPVPGLLRLGVCCFQVYGELTPDAAKSLRDAGAALILPVQIAEPFAGNELVAYVRGHERRAGWRATWLLVDAAHPGLLGGTGKTVDIEGLGRARRVGELDGLPPLLLAGGLTPENVGAAVALVRPGGIDVSSGVECAPGIKSADRMAALVRAARSA